MEKIDPQYRFHGKKIVLYGPESTGKSTLSRKLAQHYQTISIPEFAREYLQSLFDVNGHICTLEDIMPIAIGQRNAENNATMLNPKLLFCDTDVLETLVYSQIYFDTVPDELVNAVLDSQYDLYLLMDIDVPWQKDDLRDKPNDRKEIYQAFENALLRFNKKYVKISGLENQRLLNAINAVDLLLI